MFTEKDLGVWIDGAYGEAHAAEKLVVMVDDTLPRQSGRIDPKFPNEQIREAFESLVDYDESAEDDNAEFVQEDMNTLTDYLQSVTKDGLVWVWEAGDLILMREEDAE